MNFVSSLAYQFCLGSPAAFTQPVDHLFAEPCTCEFECIRGFNTVRPHNFQDFTLTITPGPQVHLPSWVCYKCALFVSTPKVWTNFMDAMPLKLLCAQDISSILYSVRIQTLLLVRDINGKKCQSKWILDAMRAMNNWTITYVMLFINVREILCLSAGMRRRFRIIMFVCVISNKIHIVRVLVSGRNCVERKI